VKAEKEEKPLIEGTAEPAEVAANGVIETAQPAIDDFSIASIDPKSPQSLASPSAPSWDEKEFDRATIGPLDVDLDRSGPPAAATEALQPPPEDVPAVAASAATDFGIERESTPEERRPFAAIDFDATRGRSRNRRVSPPVTPESDDLDTPPVPVHEPVIEASGNDWRLSLVAFLVTLTVGVVLGLVWGYRIGARQTPAETERAAADTPQTMSEGTVGRSTGQARSDQPTASSTGTSAPPPTRGRMLIRSTPAGAQVAINGKPSGHTPLDLRDMPFGSYELEFSLDGYQGITRRVTLSSSHFVDSETVRFERAAPAPPSAPAASVAPAPAPARRAARPAAIPPAPSLPPEPKRAEPSPPSAEPASRPASQATSQGSPDAGVFFDSRPSGARVLVDGRSIGTTPLRATDLPPGPHRVRFERDGYHPWATSFTAVAGREVRVSGSLEPR
jgi:hypothetical protein